MRHTWRLTFLSMVFFALAMQAQHGPRMPASDKSAAAPGWPELISSMERMHVSMASVESSGNNDVDFVRLMLPHHQAAIDMARTQLLFGSDPQMRRLAQEIITDQQSEMELMHLWLKQRQFHK